MAHTIHDQPALVILQLLVETILFIPFSVCGTDSQNTHYFANLKISDDLEFLLSDIKIYKYMLIYHSFQEN